MIKKFSLYILVFSFVSAYGCTHVVSPDLRAKVDRSLTFKEVQENPNNYKNEMVIWGGVIIQALPQKDGSTLIEVLQQPLNWREVPKKTFSFHGKFLILAKEYLNPSAYERGKRITVAGEIEVEMEGAQMEELTDNTYQYPLLLSKDIRLWKDLSYSYSNVPDYRGTWEYRHYGGILRY
jgi:outer membrane lipoprotein